MSLDWTSLGVPRVKLMALALRAAGVTAGCRVNGRGEMRCGPYGAFRPETPTSLLNLARAALKRTQRELKRMAVGSEPSSE